MNYGWKAGDKFVIPTGAIWNFMSAPIRGEWVDKYHTGVLYPRLFNFNSSGEDILSDSPMDHWISHLQHFHRLSGVADFLYYNCDSALDDIVRKICSSSMKD